MAVDYLINGTTALKPVAHEKAAHISLVPMSFCAPRTRLASVVSRVEVRPHERTEVDAVLDDFHGTSFAKTAKDRLFCITFGTVACAVLFGFTLLSLV